MPYVASNYKNNPAAPVGKWVCGPGSTHGPYVEVPTEYNATPDFCGECVSYVKRVCPSLPVTSEWEKGKPVKSATDIETGTVIATFNVDGKYQGHAAIYVDQTRDGLNVYDQFRTGDAPRPVGPRVLTFGAPRLVNNGDKFFVVK